MFQSMDTRDIFVCPCSLSIISLRLLRNTYTEIHTHLLHFQNIESEVAQKKEREMVKQETERVCSSIQTMCRSTQFLAKNLDYVQENIDAMQAELISLRQESKKYMQACEEEQR